MTTQKQIADGLRQAIQAEIEGQHFYRMAAASTRDAKGSKVFLQLAQDEVEHERFLRAQLASLEASGKTDPSVKLPPWPQAGVDSPIFSEKIRDRLYEAHYEMTALSIGIQLELSGAAFYRKQAKLADDPEIKSFFNELAQWEDGHYKMLLAQQEDLQEDYWAKAGFSPY